MNQHHICTFKGLQNLPLFVARHQGFFATRGLDIEITYTAGSLPQLAGLARGEYQLIQAAPDNVINVDNNPAAFGLDPATAPHVVMLLGGSVGPLSVYAQPAITTVDHLRGSVLGVDNPTSGFALVFRDILARNGLLLEHDYNLTVAGGTSGGLDALKSGSVDYSKPPLYVREQHATLSEWVVDWSPCSWIDEVLEAVDGNRKRR